MKKLIALLLVVLLCLSAPAARANDLDELTELTEYTYENAIKFLADREWEGFTSKIKEPACSFWLPNGMEAVELTEEDTEAGYLKVYAAGNIMAVVSVRDYSGIDLETYLELVTANKYKNPRIEPVNGVDFVIYDEPLKGYELCRVAATVLEDGSFLEFVYYSSDKKLSDPINGSIATIRFAESGRPAAGDAE